MLRPKKIHTRNLITKKKFLWLENSPPPTTTFLIHPGQGFITGIPSSRYECVMQIQLSYKRVGVAF